MALAPDLAADGADPLAALGAEGLGGKGQVQLLEDDLFEVDLVVPIKKLVHVRLIQGFLELLVFLGEEDEVEAGIDRELERLGATGAGDAQPGRDPALDPDLLGDFADDQNGVNRLEEGRGLFDEVLALELEFAVDRQAVLRDFIDVDDHHSFLGGKNRPIIPIRVFLSTESGPPGGAIH